jgi:hypothetical protein
MAESSRTMALPSTATLQVVIGALAAIIFIGKYLPHMVFITSGLSLILAILDFAVWNNVAFGVVNLLLAVGGFLFLRQLLQKRSGDRREIIAERQAEVNEPALEVPRLSMAPIDERQFKDQEAA